MKAVIFDFDGTLTHKQTNTWKRIWLRLGYDIGAGSLYSNLYHSFINGKISHQEWCDLTCRAFKEKGLTREMVYDIAEETKVIDGASDVFRILRARGVFTYIVSGNIVSVIQKSLGDDSKGFDGISANRFIFSANGDLIHIQGTEYDFEGKAKFIEELKQMKGLKNEDICFVGNGSNDEWAHLSGCKTVCINPDGTDESNSTKWHKVIKGVTDLRQILPDILSPSAGNEKIL